MTRTIDWNKKAVKAMMRDEDMTRDDMDSLSWFGDEETATTYSLVYLGSDGVKRRYTMDKKTGKKVFRPRYV